LLPLAVGAVVVLHVLLVRVHGVVPPLEAAVGDAQLRDNGTESSNPREPGQPVASAAPRTSADPKDAAL